MRAFLDVAVSLLLMVTAIPAHADERNDAVQAAREILTLLGDKRYIQVWESHTSEAVRKFTTRDHFLSNITMSRAMLGRFSSAEVINIDFTTYDPTLQYNGRIYAVTFISSYPIGQVYDRIVVARDSDGRFRLGGFWAVPAPRQ